MGRRRVRKGVATAAAVVGTAGVVLLPSFPAVAAIGSSDTWRDTTRVLAESVPAGVCGIRFTLRGGAGAALDDTGDPGVVVFTMPVTPGTDFRVSVGAVGRMPTGAPAIGPQIGGLGTVPISALGTPAEGGGSSASRTGATKAGGVTAGGGGAVEGNGRDDGRAGIAGGGEAAGGSGSKAGSAASAGTSQPSRKTDSEANAGKLSGNRRSDGKASDGQASASKASGGKTSGGQSSGATVTGGTVTGGTVTGGTVTGGTVTGGTVTGGTASGGKTGDITAGGGTAGGSGQGGGVRGERVAGDGSARAVTGPPGPGGGGATVLRYDGAVVAVAGGGGATGTRGANFLAAGLTAQVNGTFGVRAAGQVTAEYTTPCSPPDVPARLSVAVTGDKQVAVGFCPVESGFAIAYELRVDGGGWAAFDAAPTGRVRRGCAEVGGTQTVLATGRTHVFRVRARYAGLTTRPSGPGRSVSLFMPALAPAPPTGVRAVLGDRAVKLDFQAPDDGGSAISHYQYKIDKGEWTVLGKSGVISGLTVRPAAYHLQLRAVNSVKPGPAAAPVTFVAESVPGAPSGLTAEASKGRAVVYFAPGPATSKEANRYEVSIDGGATWTVSPTVRIPDAGRSVTINGLQNGESYPVRLRAANSHGTGPESEVLDVVLAAVVPSAPTGLAVEAGDRSATLTFAAPGQDGGRPITGYEYSLGGDWRTLAVTAVGPARTGTIHGLSPTKAYDLQVRAVTEVGGGDPSAITSLTAVGSPEAPSHVSVADGNEQATLIIEPGDGTGPKITGWEVSVDDGIWLALPTMVDDRGVIRGDVTGLTNGQAPALRVRGQNSLGGGVPSAAVIAHPKADRPTVPLQLTAQAGTGGAVLTFARPVNDGGAPITRYEVSTGGDRWTSLAVDAAGTARTGTLSLLTGGTTYPIRVRAVNIAGAGPATAPVAVTPAATELRVAGPATPTDLAVTAQDGSLRVKFKADRNAPAYEVSIDDGSTWSRLESARTGAAVEATVAGLDNGKRYQVRVRAVRDAVKSASSRPVAAAPDPGPEGAATAVPSDYSNIAAGENPNLPRTGGGLFPIGVFLVVSGAGLVILGYRRKRTTS